MKTILATIFALAFAAGCSNEVAHGGFTEPTASVAVTDTIASCGTFAGGTAYQGGVCPAGKTIVGGSCEFSGGTAQTSHYVAADALGRPNWACEADIHGAGSVTICARVECQ